MRIRINNPKANWVFYNGKDLKTNEYIDLPFSDAMRLTRAPGMSVDMDCETVPYNPDLFGTHKSFAMIADIDTVSGWGNVGLNLVKSIDKLYSVSLIGKTLNVNEGSVVRASRKPVDQAMGVVIHEQPKAAWDMLPFDRKIAIVPFETTQIPPTWIPRINRCKALFVPCRQNIEAFRDSGVTVPIELIHWGIDTDMFYPVDRSNDRPFTFGTMGALSVRKGTDILVNAFLRAFPTEKDVKLICKTSNNGFMFGVKDKRVQVDMTPVSHSDLMHSFFSKVDCFVFPTRGEGFGLTPLEAMATGMPAIVTNWSGPTEYMNDEVGWSIDYTMDEAKEFSNNVYKEPCGNWAVPSIDHLVHLMRYAYEHRDEVKAKGQKAAEYVKENWTWEKKIPMFVEALQKHL